MPSLPILVVSVLLAVPAPSARAAFVASSPLARLASLAASYPVRVAPLGASFGWPVSPPRVMRRFDPPPRPWLAGHRGVDLAAAPSAAVLSAGAGTVVFAGEVAGRGVVSVAHPGGLRTTYEPVTSTVAVGDRLALGDPIGRLAAGHPGCAASACLHWGLRRDDLYLDPLALLGLGRVRLLPLSGAALSGAALGGAALSGAALGGAALSGAALGGASLSGPS